MELLVLVSDNGPGRRRGTVLLVQPDGWPWTAREREAAHTRVVVAALPDGMAEELLAPQVPDRIMLPNDPRRARLERRCNLLDLDHYDATGELRLVRVPVDLGTV